LLLLLLLLLLCRAIIHWEAPVAHNSISLADERGGKEGGGQLRQTKNHMFERALHFGLINNQNTYTHTHNQVPPLYSLLVHFLLVVSLPSTSVRLFLYLLLVCGVWRRRQRRMCDHFRRWLIRHESYREENGMLGGRGVQVHGERTSGVSSWLVFRGREREKSGIFVLFCFSSIFMKVI
jgi:hypothetical protein